MLKALSLGGLIGGLVLFAWGVVSWMLLPWHLATLEKFKDEAKVAQALTANATTSGVYLLPNVHKHEPGLTEAKGKKAEMKGKKAEAKGKKAEAKRKKAEAEGMKRMIQGLFMFAAVNLQGTSGSGAALPVQLVTSIVSAILATWLLMNTTLPSYWQRVGFLVILALTAGVICHVPNWNWWGFSASYTAVAFADLLIGWALAGLVIAKVTSSGSTWS
jgi:hypothetical protein